MDREEIKKKIEKKKFFAAIECQLINVKRMMELEKSHLATIIVKMEEPLMDAKSGEYL